MLPPNLSPQPLTGPDLNAASHPPLVGDKEHGRKWAGNCLFNFLSWEIFTSIDFLSHAGFRDVKVAAASGDRVVTEDSPHIFCNPKDVTQHSC